MNERIRKLAEQQGLTGPNYLISSQELEKFAELIVRECATLANDCPSDYLLKPGRYPSTWIKQHFGVEE